MADAIKTVVDVKSRLAWIEKYAAEHDYEVAHGLQDDLMADVLTAVASGADNSAELASAALKVLEIKFARHCA